MKKLVATIAVALMLSVNIAFAGTQILSRAFEPLANISIADIYMTYASIVDFFLVFVIFGVLAKVSLGNKYGDTTKGVAVVVGLMLALAFSFMEQRYNFHIGDMGWLAMVIFFAFFVFFIYSVMVGMGAGPKLSIAVLYMIAYAMVGAFFPQAFEWLNAKGDTSFGIALLLLVIHVVLIMAVVKMIMSVISFKNKFD